MLLEENNQRRTHISNNPPIMLTSYEMFYLLRVFYIICLRARLMLSALFLESAAELLAPFERTDFSHIFSKPMPKCDIL